MRMPCLLHCPRGAPKVAFRTFVTHYLAACELPRSPTVELITYNNGFTRFPVEVQAERLGLRLHVVARQVRPWSFAAKITEPKSLLEGLLANARLIMLIDGNDTIFTRPPYIAEILEVLDHYGSPDVLFCPTCADWPPNKECRVFERSLSSSSKPHLSSGAYVGSVCGILEGINWIEERRRMGRFRHGGRFDDQLAWRKTHLALHPQFGIDTEGRLFNRFDQLFLRERISRGKLETPSYG